MLRISVLLELEAKSKRELPIDILNFTIEDRNGHQYRPTLAGCGAALKRDSLTLGQKVEGEVAFDVPINAHDLELLFEPFLVGRTKISGRVQVPSYQAK